MVGDDPRGVECWCKPCGSDDCKDFGPKNCPARPKPSLTSLLDRFLTWLLSALCAAGFQRL